MGFEKFTETGKSYRPKLSIRKNGQIGLNQGAVTRYKLTEQKYVVLYFDRDNKRIGLKFTYESEDGAIQFRERQMNISIPAKSFLDYYAIEYRTKVTRVELQRDEESGLLVAQL